MPAFRPHLWLASIFLLLPLSAFCAEEQPRSVILMIGDGMGLAHVTALRSDQREPLLERFPVVGLVDTRPAGGEWVTDSAAAATAMATGVSVPNGVIAQDQNGRPLPTVLERAEAEGKATGLVSSSSVTHATPAAFYAHVTHRDQESEIAGFLPASGLDVYFGAGWAFFVPQTYAGSRRSDTKDLLAQLRSRGLIVARGEKEYRDLPAEAARVAAFLAPEALPRASVGRIGTAELTSQALTRLSKMGSKGFFLMVEGSEIDWACHDRNAADLMAELGDFAGAVKTAADYAAAHADTLLIVTADHETGGLTIEAGKDPAVLPHLRFTSKDHSGTLVPLFALGPGSRAFAGVMTNAELGRRLLEVIAGAPR